MSFKDGHHWGAATSSYQIEGRQINDGSGASIWDEFCSKEGNVQNKENGDVACQHIVHLEEDVQLMKKMGLTAYRFSVSWPRVLPLGQKGPMNEKGLAFYDRLVDLLCEADIVPFLTLFHWDLPLKLHQEGGWLNPKSPEWFADYSSILVDKLGDRVKHWMTFNEPNIFLPYGYALGSHAPGEKRTQIELLRMHRNLLIAHGHAVEIIRSGVKGSFVGIAPALTVPMPATNQTKDIEAAEHYMMSASEDCLDKGDHVWRKISWWTEPIFRGVYPEGADLRNGKEGMEILTESEMKKIMAPLDFLGLNIYSGFYMDSSEYKKFPLGFPVTTMGWPVVPESLYWGPKMIYDRYRCPIYITENGMASPDWIHEGGGIPDSGRIDFLRRYLSELHRSQKDGVDLRGYFLWSLFDNFEWAYGYNQRFGLIHVDFKTQKRTWKDSAHWYRKVISTKGKILEIEK